MIKRRLSTASTASSVSSSLGLGGDVGTFSHRLSVASDHGLIIKIDVTVETSSSSSGSSERGMTPFGSPERQRQRSMVAAGKASEFLSVPSNE